MPRIAYAVTATLPNEQTHDDFITWLRGSTDAPGHLQDVIDAGALTAQMIILDADPGEPPHRVQSSYTFESRSVFDTYVKDKAPALRAQGLALFGPQTGVSFSRTAGTIPD